MRTTLCLLALIVGCGDAGPPAGSPDGAAGNDDAAANGISYQAIALATALDRIAIVRTDRAAGVCGLLRLAAPGGGGVGGITTPTDWGVDMIGASEVGSRCPAEPAFPSAEVMAISGSGEVTFTVPAGLVFPTTIAVEATITFDPVGAPAWLPTEIAFAATDLVVVGP